MGTVGSIPYQGLSQPQAAQEQAPTLYVMANNNANRVEALCGALEAIRDHLRGDGGKVSQDNSTQKPSGHINLAKITNDGLSYCQEVASQIASILGV